MQTGASELTYQEDTPQLFTAAREHLATAGLFTSSEQAPATFTQLIKVSLGFRVRSCVLLLLCDFFLKKLWF